MLFDFDEFCKGICVSMVDMIFVLRCIIKVS